MEFETVKSWFTRWAARQTKKCRLLGILGLVLAPIAVAAATTAIYSLLRLFTHDAAETPGDSTKCWYISLAMIPLFFLGNLVMPRRDLMEEQLTEGISYTARRQVAPLLFMWFLFTGPRLINWARDSFREAGRWQSMDVHSCAAVLFLLMTKSGKVPFAEMQQKLDWLNLETTLPEMRRIPGIVFLSVAPPGLSLTQDFREQLRAELMG